MIDPATMGTAPKVLLQMLEEKATDAQVEKMTRLEQCCDFFLQNAQMFRAILLQAKETGAGNGGA